MPYLAIHIMAARFGKPFDLGISSAASNDLANLLVSPRDEANLLWGSIVVLIGQAGPSLATTSSFGGLHGTSKHAQALIINTILIPKCALHAHILTFLFYSQF